MIAKSKSKQPRSATAAQSSVIEDRTRQEAPPVVRETSNNPYSRDSSLSPGRIALGYAVLAILWIAFSDSVVTHFKLHPAVMTIKGTVFVFVTASLLYFTIRRLVQAVQLTSRERDETANLYRTVVEATNEGICLLDESGRITFLNGRLAAMLGRPAEELLGKRLQDFIEQPDALAQQSAAQPETHECRLRTDSDRKPWVLISRHPVLNDAGEVLQWVATAIDVTERKHAEEALALRSFALNNALDAVLLIDDQARFLYVNEECCRRLGYTREELLGMAVPDIEADFREGHWPEHWRTLKAQESLNFETHHRTKDGRLFPVEISAKYLEYGDRAFNLAVARDITERKRAEDELRRSEAHLAEAQSLSHTGSWYLELDHNRLFWSDEVFRMFGIPLGAPQTYDTFLSAVHTDDRDLVDVAWKNALHGAPYDVEHRILVGGEVRWVRDRARLEFDADGRATKGIGTVQDITERKRADQALRERADLLNLTHDTVFVMDLKGVIKYWNRGAEEHYGWSAEQAVGRVVHEMLNTVFPSPLEEIKAELTQGGRWEGELLHTKRDGTQIVVASRWALQRDEQGSPVAILETNNDITERKRTEEALRQSEAYLREAQRLSHTGSWAFDVIQGKYVYVSEECFRIFGLDPQEGLPSTEMFRQRIHPDDLETVNQGFGKSVREKVGSSQEFRIVHSDGAVKTVHMTRHPVLNSAGDLVKFFGTAVDITERKQAEAALRESETRFRTFVDHAGDALFVQDLELGTIVDVNRHACENLGYTRQELIGKTPLAFHLDSDRAERTAAEARAAAGEPATDRHYHRRKDGSTFPVEAHTNLVSYGGRFFLLKVARDISDRVQAEEDRERLRQLETELAHLGRLTMLGELTASLAHELNQPITAAIASAGACLRWLARDPPELERARAATLMIQQNGTRAAEIINRLRAFYKKGAPPQREWVDVGEIANEMILLLADEANRHGIAIRTELRAGLPRVLADRVQLQQILMNLMLNAFEAMQDHGGELTIRAQLDDDQAVQTSISDTGVGLPADNVDQIFQAFFTTKPKGTGLGLAITRSLVEAHGGRLWATNNVERGATFHFTLPADAGPMNRRSGVADALHH